MKNEYVKLIIELDRVLAMLRELWMNSFDEIDRAKWRDRISHSLDERLRLMKLRDERALEIQMLYDL